jgi:hypothetical protein
MRAGHDEASATGHPRIHKIKCHVNGDDELTNASTCPDVFTNLSRLEVDTASVSQPFCSLGGVTRISDVNLKSRDLVGMSRRLGLTWR